jgi:gas vesicle protein
VAVNVGGKAIARAQFETVEELNNIIKSNDDTGTKLAKSAVTALDLKNKIVVNATDVVFEFAGGIVKGAVGLFNDDAAQAVDEFCNDAKTVKNAILKPGPESGKVIKSAAKSVLGEENYNSVRDSYHEAKQEAKQAVKAAKQEVKETLNSAKSVAKEVKNEVKETVKEAKQEAKQVVKDTVHSTPVQKTVKAVESLPGGKTIVSGAKKLYHWMGFK